MAELSSSFQFALENVPRMFNDDLQAQIEMNWTIPPIFTYLKGLGELNTKDCLETFNMGIGLVLAVSKENVKQVTEILTSNGQQVWQIGILQERPTNATKIVIK